MVGEEQQVLFNVVLLGTRLKVKAIQYRGGGYRF